MKNPWLRAIQLALLSSLTLPPWPSHAAIFEIFPSSADSSCNEEFENRANGLKPKPSMSVHVRAMRMMLKAAGASLFRGEPFPWPEPGPRAIVAGLLSKLGLKRKAAAG